VALPAALLADNVRLKVARSGRAGENRGPISVVDVMDADGQRPDSESADVGLPLLNTVKPPAAPSLEGHVVSAGNDRSLQCRLGEQSKGRMELMGTDGLVVVSTEVCDPPSAFS